MEASRRAELKWQNLRHRIFSQQQEEGSKLLARNSRAGRTVAAPFVTSFAEGDGIYHEVRVWGLRLVLVGAPWRRLYYHLRVRACDVSRQCWSLGRPRGAESSSQRSAAANRKGASESEKIGEGKAAGFGRQLIESACEQIFSRQDGVGSLGDPIVKLLNRTTDFAELRADPGSGG